MKKELQEKLIKNNLFLFGFTGKKIVHKGSGEIWEMVNQPGLLEPVQHGVATGDGWYDLLNDLLRNIRLRIENDFISQKFRHKFKFTENLQIFFRRKDWTKTADFINKISPKKKPIKLEFRVTQIKSKFGGLRFYYDGGDDVIRGMVQLAEALSWRICETCGTTKNIGGTTHWIETICGSCWKKHPKFGQREWAKHNENFYMF